MIKLLREVFGILLIPLAAGFAIEAYRYVIDSTDDWLGTPFSLGFGISFLVFFILLYGIRWRFARVFEHELGHLAFLLLFLAPPGLFRVTPAGGRVETAEGYSTGCLVGPFVVIFYLGPYILPVFTIPFVLTKLYVPRFGSAVDFLIGFMLAFYLLRVFSDMRPWNQPPPESDLWMVGFIFSYVAIFLLNSILVVAVVAFMIDDWPMLRDYLSDALYQAQQYYAAAWSWLQDLAGPLLDSL